MMRIFNFKRIYTVLAVLFLCLPALMLSGCGGGGGSTGGTSLSVGGKVVDGPVSGATMTVYQVTATGLVNAGTGTTGTDGSFSLSISNYNSSDYYIFFVTGGQFSNNKITTNAPTMVGILPPGGSAQVFITPVSTLIGANLLHNGSLVQGLDMKVVDSAIVNGLTSLGQIFPVMNSVGIGNIASADPGATTGIGNHVAALNSILQNVSNNIVNSPAASGETYEQAMADLANYFATNATGFGNAMQNAGSGSFSLSGITITGGSGGTVTISGTVSSSMQNSMGQVMGQHTVTYSAPTATGGSVPVDTTQYEMGAKVTVLGNTQTLTRTGYTFAGWSTSATATSASYTGGSTFTMGTANVTLYAVWTLTPTYTMTYNANGATGGSVPVDSNNYEQNATVTVAGNTGSLVRTDYTFEGWSTSQTGSAIGTTLTMGTSNVTLYAVWTATSGSATVSW